MFVGMFLQTFLLALNDNGVGSCCLISVAGYPEVLKREFGMQEDLVPLCGLAIGYSDESSVNKVDMGREEMGKCFTFHHE